MKFKNIICNLRYVTVDRDAARSHWWDMVEISQLNRGFWSVNQRELVSQKAVAGILSHRQTRNFVFHRIRERAIRRRLAA